MKIVFRLKKPSYTGYRGSKKNALPTSQKSTYIFFGSKCFFLLICPPKRLNVAPYLPTGCQDVIGSNPSVFLDKNNFLERSAKIDLEKFKNQTNFIKFYKIVFNILIINM